MLSRTLFSVGGLEARNVMDLKNPTELDHVLCNLGKLFGRNTRGEKSLQYVAAISRFVCTVKH